MGIEVRVLRVMHGWSQEVLAEVAGLHRNYVGYVERGERNVGIDNLERLAMALGVPIAWLIWAGDGGTRRETAGPKEQDRVLIGRFTQTSSDHSRLACQRKATDPCGSGNWADCRAATGRRSGYSR
ncbi:MAG TPA: helix-turn-helix transcriptional regulator [Acidiferrobacterales bacterium]